MDGGSIPPPYIPHTCGSGFRVEGIGIPRVQAPNLPILFQGLYYNCDYQSPEYPIIGQMDPEGYSRFRS